MVESLLPSHLSLSTICRMAADEIVEVIELFVEVFDVCVFFFPLVSCLLNLEIMLMIIGICRQCGK